MRPLLLLSLIPTVVSAPWSAAHWAAPETIGVHDNATPAGEIRDGALRLALEIRPGTWRPNGEHRPGVTAFAWAEQGKSLTVPGPLIRVPTGTAMQVSVRNLTDSTLIVRGLGDTRADSLVLAAGASDTIRGRPMQPGNRMYSATVPSRSPTQRGEVDAHAVGAFIVDGAERSQAGARVREHVLVISGGYYHRDSTGALTVDREIFVVNGRPWPHTQRLQGSVGDSLRFRVINASPDIHPIHLHGTYYRVESTGDFYGDTALVGDAQRQVVTEFMSRATTMTIAWMPDRPGTWLFHCHLTFHVVGNIGFGSEEETSEQQEHRIVHGPAGVSHDEHVEKAMGGLMLAIEVPPPPGWRLPTRARRVVRVVIPRDSQPQDARPVFAPSVEDERGQVPAVTRRGPGALLLLREGEPTALRVVNQSVDHVAMHWHGMELESYYDGVVGLGGTANRRMRAIVPADSFDALMTPPRPGTFIYHTHLGEVRQQESGLYGPMIVLPRGETWNSERDHVFLASTFVGLGPLMNGDSVFAPLRLAPGAHRLRFINITTGSGSPRFRIVGADSGVVTWTAVAKDGMTLPDSRRTSRPALQMISMGETYDFEVNLPPGRYQLELRTAAGRLASRQPFEVRSLR